MAEKKKKRKLFRQLKLVLHHGFLLDYLPDLTGAEYKVYTAIAMHANWFTGRASPTFETISRITGIKNQRSISRAVDGLKTKGIIEVEFRRAKSLIGKEHGRKRFFYKTKYPAKSEYVKKD